MPARLVGKPMFLRGQWSEGKLSFDEHGSYHGKPGKTSFTLAGVTVISVARKGKRIQLACERDGLQFTADHPRRVMLSQPITILIDPPSSNDFEPAIEAIFAPDLQAMLPLLPDFWQEFAAAHLAAVPGVAPESADLLAAKAIMIAPKDTNGTITYPKLIYQVDPKFTKEAHSLSYAGEGVISLVVEVTGLPGHVRVKHPIGMGLDESSVLAVSGYRFQPAMRDGLPIAVVLDVAVNFSYR